MKAFLLANPPLEQLAQQETQELINTPSKILGPGILELQTTKENLLLLAQYSQSLTKIILALNTKSDFQKFNLSKINFNDFLTKKSTFKIDVLGVKGQENRTEISKAITKTIFNLNPNKKPTINYKNPDTIFLVYFDQKKYYLGIDLIGFDLNKRSYRLFPHQSSFKGDFAYYLIRTSKFQPGEKLIVGFSKDGTLPIEAALFNFRKPLPHLPFACQKLPLFKDTPSPQLKPRTKGQVTGFDNNMMNLRAAKKNSQLAKVKELLNLNKFDLDELDVKFKKAEINRLIFHLTRKDEDKLNEIYYQADYILKKKATLLFITRENYEFTLSNKFKLLKENLLKKGDSGWKIILLEKK